MLSLGFLTRTRESEPCLLRPWRINSGPRGRHFLNDEMLYTSSAQHPSWTGHGQKLWLQWVLSASIKKATQSTSWKYRLTVTDLTYTPLSNYPFLDLSWNIKNWPVIRHPM
jgi:hypothetical protein